MVEHEYTFFFYKKPCEGPSSKSFLFLAKNCMFLVPKVSYVSFLIFPVRNGFLISIKVARVS